MPQPILWLNRNSALYFYDPRVINQHAQDLVAIDFFLVPTPTLRVLFVFVILAHDRRRIVHFNVTEDPTAQWTAQQLLEAFPFDAAPRHHPQRAASQATLIVVFGLLPSLANAPVLGPGCTGGSPRTISRTRQRSRVPCCPRSRSLLSFEGGVNIRDPQEVNYVSNTDKYIKPQHFFASSKFLRNIRSDPFLRYRTVPAKARMSSIRRSGCSMAPKWPPRGISVQ